MLVGDAHLRLCALSLAKKRQARMLGSSVGRSLSGSRYVADGAARSLAWPPSGSGYCATCSAAAHISV